MRRRYILIVFGLLISVSPLTALGAPREIVDKGSTYYVVSAEDPSQDTGAEVCALVGKTCAGYTAFTNDVCLAAHPSAAKKSDANGSKAGFYCDGPPQGGVCANERNTCHVCPACNVNIDCATPIGGLYREMYVTCEGGAASSPTLIPAPIVPNTIAVQGGWWWRFRSTVARAFDFFRQKLGLLTVKKVTRAIVQVQGPQGTVDVNIPQDSYACEFYQKNKKLVTCGALAAADSFCVKAMNSRFATAELCQDDGLILCSVPCVTNPREIKPTRCAFDADRPRGNQASPLDFCTKTVTIDPNAAPTKKAGQECAHGGECATGYCLGQPSDQGIKYFCSCKQNVLDYTCGI